MGCSSDLRIGEIEAWRTWKIHADASPWLASVTIPYHWRPGVNAARCYRWGPGRPGSGWLPPSEQWGARCDGRRYARHSCGLYALSDPRRVWTEYGARCFTLRAGIALGRVALWGHVVEGTRGYRAEYARIVGLCRHPQGEPGGEVLEQFAERYRVPIIANPLEEMAA